MSTDYTTFQDGIIANLTNLSETVDGSSQDQIQDHSYQVLSEIPVLLKSRISIEMRAMLLRQYTEIKGHTRDMALGELSREAFYSFGKDSAIKEIKFAEQKKANMIKSYESLKGFLGDESKEEFDKVDAEHKILKSQLATVIKSELGIPEDRTVGPNEVGEFLNLPNSNNT